MARNDKQLADNFVSVTGEPEIRIEPDECAIVLSFDKTKSGPPHVTVYVSPDDSEFIKVTHKYGLALGSIIAGGSEEHLLLSLLVTKVMAQVDAMYDKHREEYERKAAD